MDSRLLGARAVVVTTGTFLNGLIHIGEKRYSAGRSGELPSILLAENLEATNGASYLALADGQWREGAEAFERVFLLFGAATIDDARATWRSLDGREGLERNYWRQVARTKWERAA